MSVSFKTGIMTSRAGIVLVLVLGASLVCDAKDLRYPIIPDNLVLQMKHQEFDGNVKASEEATVIENICTLCEEFSTDVLDYLEDNSTQTEIIDILYQTCSDLHSIKNQCITMVDCYVPLVFTEISSVQPKQFCQYVDLCEEGAIKTEKKSNEKCANCKHIIAEVLTKLEDPDTELEIIELLLKACNAAEGRKNVRKCKTLVFKYGPLILESAPQLIQKLNLCTAIHACNSSSSGSNHKYFHSAS